MAHRPSAVNDPHRFASLAVCGKLRRTGLTSARNAVALKPGISTPLSICLVLALAAAVAGCSEFGFGTQPDKRVDANKFPENYKQDLLTYVRAHPAELLNVREASISAPALNQFGTESRYFICLRATSPDWRKEKMVIFFGGRMNQFVDADNQHCGAAQYQPFPELMTELSNLKKDK
jgi:hypothetical protein